VSACRTGFRSSSPERRLMRLEAVISLYSRLQQAGIPIWLDGGWGVDALLGYQTREHSDLDLVVEDSDLPRLNVLLLANGFTPCPSDDCRPWNFVLAHPGGELIDIHVVSFDGYGDGIYGPPENGQLYPAAAFAGRGQIGGLRVFCLTPEYQLESHRGYPPRGKDFQDVRALAAAFKLPIPAEYSLGRDGGS